MNLKLKMFKKKKIGKTGIKRLTRKNVVTINIGILSIFFIILIGYGFIHQISKTKFNLDSIFNIIGFNSILDELGKDTSIKKSQDGKTNILIIGRGGQESESPELTDLIIIASINYKKQYVSIFSIPRDLYVEFPTSGYGKINEVYFRGIKKFNNKILGIESLKEVLTQITGEKIHYFVDIDFKGFKQLIDSIGGIDINIPETIVDTAFPGPNWGYKTFSIKAGQQTIDGETTLKYVRSRYSTSDFDRSIRQQLVIEAIANKILSTGFLSDPKKIGSFFSILTKNILTDIDISQVISLSLFLKNIPKDNIINSNLNSSCSYGNLSCKKGGFLYSPNRANYNGAFVLLQDGSTKGNLNYDYLIKYANLVFNYSGIYKENLKINIFNATKKSGLAVGIANNLKKYGFNIPTHNSVGNIKNKIFEKSKIFYKAGSGGVKPETVEALELFIFGGSHKVDVLPEISKDDDVKIQIIIGNDYEFLNF